MSGRRSRESRGAIDVNEINNPTNTTTTTKSHVRGISIETDPLPPEIEKEMEKVDPQNAMIQDSLFQISANHKAVKSAELTSNDELGSDNDDDNHNNNNRHNNNHDNDSDSDDSLTASDKHRSARDSMIMEDLLGIANKATNQRLSKTKNMNKNIPYTNSNGNINENTTYEDEIEMSKNKLNQKRSSTKLANVVNFHLDPNQSGSSNGGSRRDSIEMAIEQNGESFVNATQKEKKWTHARKVSANVVRQKSNHSLKSNESNNNIGFTDDNDMNTNTNTNTNDNSNETTFSNSISGLNAYEITYESTDSDEAEANFAEQQHIYATTPKNTKQRPSINTALNAFDNAKDLEDEIESNLVKEKKWTHARKASTQLVRQKSRKKIEEDMDEQNAHVFSNTNTPFEDINENGSDMNNQNYNFDNDNSGNQNNKHRKNESVSFVDNARFLDENESAIMSGIQKQQQLAKHQKSHISRTFSNEDVKKIKDRTANKNNNNNNNNTNNSSETNSDSGKFGDYTPQKIPTTPDMSEIQRNNKTRGSQIIRGIEIEQLAQITGTHKREASLTQAYMGAFGNDENVAGIAASLASFMQVGTTDNSNNNNNNNENKNSGNDDNNTSNRENELLSQIKNLKKVQSDNENEINRLEKLNSDLQSKYDKLEEENKQLSNKMVKINNEYHNEIERLEAHIENLEKAKIESIQQMALEFNHMRAAIKSLNRQ